VVAIMIMSKSYNVVLTLPGVLNYIVSTISLTLWQHSATLVDRFVLGKRINE